MAGKVMIGEDTGRDDDPPLPMQFNRFRCWSFTYYKYTCNVL
jgi:hypothetical protein